MFRKLVNNVLYEVREQSDKRLRPRCGYNNKNTKYVKHYRKIISTVI